MANKTSKCAANQILQDSKFGQQHKTKKLLEDILCRALIDANGVHRGGYGASLSWDNKL